MPRFIRLTHRNELSRETNTGRLMDTLPRGLMIPWDRKTPDPRLPGKRSVLVYRGKYNQPCENPGEMENFIFIDGTWQEANKIYNRSPYLHSIPKIELMPPAPSLYRMRRNQRPGGICTAEAAILVLRLIGDEAGAGELEKKLLEFLMSCSGRKYPES